MTPTQQIWNELLLEQITYHWDTLLRPRLTGLTDEEYRWEPTPGAWNVHVGGGGNTAEQFGGGDATIDWEFPEPTPAPVTTIAWRLGHIIVGVLGARVAGHFDGPPIDYPTFHYAATADEALAQLDEQYAAWIAGVRSWGDDLDTPVGEAEGPWAESPRTVLVLHINRELIHHGAEISLLRDLWVHRND